MRVYALYLLDFKGYGLLRCCAACDCWVCVFDCVLRLLDLVRFVLLCFWGLFWAWFCFEGVC